MDLFPGILTLRPFLIVKLVNLVKLGAFGDGKS